MKLKNTEKIIPNKNHDYLLEFIWFICFGRFIFTIPFGDKIYSLINQQLSSILGYFI